MATVQLNPQYPPIFASHLETESLEDIVKLYTDYILGDVSNKDVERALVEYVTQFIEPVGWRGIWRARKKSSGLSFDCDFLVEVLNVSLIALTAEVEVISLLSECSCSRAALDHILGRNSICVPLIELYTLFEDDPCINSEKTAAIIEDVRFFHTHVLRPWDDLEDDEEIFSAKVHSRVKLYMDLRDHLLPGELEARASAVLSEGWELRERLDELQVEMPLSDSESELSEEDVAEILVLKIRLEELCREMEILENPLLRNILLKNNFLRRPLRFGNARRDDGPIVHVVAESFTLAKLQMSNVDPEACLEFHHSLTSAFSSLISGDKIVVLPGIHRCVTLPWFESDATIEGLGNRDETIVSLCGAGDILFNCSTPSLSISNITFRSSTHLKCLIMLHSGSVCLRNCYLDGTTSDTCFTVLKNAELTLEQCEISFAMVDGIAVRAGGILKTKRCTVSHCQRNGIIAEYEPELQIPTTMDLEETTVENNGCYGVLVENVPPDENSNLKTLTEEGLGDMDRSCLGVTTRNCIFKDNFQGSFGIENTES